MCKTESDSRSVRYRRHWVATRRLELLRCLASADDAFAIPFRNVDPCLRIAIQFGCSAARIVSGRRAVVFGRLRDAVAFFGLEAWRRHRLLRRKSNGADADSYGVTIKKRPFTWSF